MAKSTSSKALEWLLLLLFWLYVSIPLGWGIWSTLQKAFTLFA